MSDELLIERKPYTPVQVEEKREAGRSLDVDVPRMQANIVSVAAARILASIILAIVTFGPMVFWGIAFAIGLTTFIWYMVQARKWVDVDANGTEHNCLDLGAMVRGAFLTMFVAFLAWCLWRVASFMLPSVSVKAEKLIEFASTVTIFVKAAIALVLVVIALCITLGKKSSRLWTILLGIGLILALALIYATFSEGDAKILAGMLKYTRGILALGALLFLVYSIFNYVHLELAFGQELAYRSPLFEQHFFEKFFDWLFGWLYRGKPVPEGYKPPPVVEEVLVDFTERGDNGGTPRNIRRGVLLSGSRAGEKARQVARIIIGGGQFSEPMLVTEGPLNRSELEEMREGLEISGYGKWRDPDNHNLGFEITARGMAVFRVLASGNGHESV